jgi:hypothetical protein
MMIDRYTKMMLTVIAVMLTLVAMGLWIEKSPSVVTEAYAGIPDSGQQLDELITSVNNIQGSLDSMAALLVSGKVKVKVVAPKEKKN